VRGVGRRAELLEEIVKRRGQFIGSPKLNPGEPVSMTANVDFSIPAPQRADFEKFLEKLGPTFARGTTQLPPNAVATSRKVGYSLSLRSLAGIDPRETFVTQIVSQTGEALGSPLAKSGTQR